MKKWLSVLRFGESGQALVPVLVMMVLGSLLVIPVLDFTSTSLKTSQTFEKNLEGLYAADAGIEDAMWKLKYNTPDDFPHEYQITGINGMSVDITIDRINSIAGEEVGDPGGHRDWLSVDESVSYDSGFYSYIMSLSNITPKNIKIIKILIDLPPGVGYVSDSTSSNVTDPLDANPTTIIGTSATGITMVWENPDPPVVKNETKYHCFELSGPPGIEGVEGHGFVEALSEDVGTVWISDVAPFTITAQAKDALGAEVITIRTGVWVGSDLDVSCWEIKQ